MASILKPEILTYIADGAIAKGKAVKIGSSNKHVVIAAGNTDKCIGICQNVVTAADDLVEVAVNGGALALAKEGITAGKFLVSNADGSLEQTNAANDFFIAQALEDASAADLFSVVITRGVAGAADQ